MVYPKFREVADRYRGQLEIAEREARLIQQNDLPGSIFVFPLEPVDITAIFSILRGPTLDAYGSVTRVTGTSYLFSAE